MGGATVVSSGPMGMPGAAVGTEVGSSVVAGSTAAPPSAITPVAIVNKFGADKAFAVVFLLLYNQNKSRPETVLNIAHTYLNKIGPTPADKGHYMQGVLGKLQGHRDHLPKVFETCEKFSSETVPKVLAGAKSKVDAMLLQQQNERSQMAHQQSAGGPGLGVPGVTPSALGGVGAMPGAVHGSLGGPLGGPAPVGAPTDGTTGVGPPSVAGVTGGGPTPGPAPGSGAPTAAVAAPTSTPSQDQAQNFTKRVAMIHLLNHMIKFGQRSAGCKDPKTCTCKSHGAMPRHITQQVVDHARACQLGKECKTPNCPNVQVYHQHIKRCKQSEKLCEVCQAAEKEERECPVCTSMECALLLTKLDTAHKDFDTLRPTLAGPNARETAIMDDVDRLFKDVQEFAKGFREVSPVSQSQEEYRNLKFKMHGLFTKFQDFKGICQSRIRPPPPASIPRPMPEPAKRPRSADAVLCGLDWREDSTSHARPRLTDEVLQWSMDKVMNRAMLDHGLSMTAPMARKVLNLLARFLHTLMQQLNLLSQNRRSGVSLAPFSAAPSKAFLSISAAMKQQLADSTQRQSAEKRPRLSNDGHKDAWEDIAVEYKGPVRPLQPLFSPGMPRPPTINPRDVLAALSLLGPGFISAKADLQLQVLASRGV